MQLRKTKIYTTYIKKDLKTTFLKQKIHHHKTYKKVFIF